MASLNLSRAIVVIKLLLQIWPWCHGDNTPDFDGVTRGFVTVTRGTHLKKHRSAILSPFMLSRDNGWIGIEKSDVLYIYGGEVKELDVFLEFGGFFGKLFRRAMAGGSWR
jgi:hypothetical protein